MGAYQAGAYEGLAEAGIEVEWVVGLSIGAINASLIAGNEPERRVERLREFWQRVSEGPFIAPAALEPFRPVFERMYVAGAATFGVPGFFSPRVPSPYAATAGTQGALSFYDSAPLAQTLAELVDFDLVNRDRVRLSLGAVDVRSGERVYFDNARVALSAAHVAASSALPPAFAPVEIDGDFYWDGGLASGSAVWYVFDEAPHAGALVLQLDLFDSRGDVPQDMEQVQERAKDIQYASKQRLSWERIREREELRGSLRRVLERLPPELHRDDDVRRLARISAAPSLRWVRLVNRRTSNSSPFKDADYSRATVNELWNAGREDIRSTLRGEAWETATLRVPGVFFVDASSSTG